MSISGFVETFSSFVSPLEEFFFFFFYFIGSRLQQQIMSVTKASYCLEKVPAGNVNLFFFVYIYNNIMHVFVYVKWIHTEP